MAVLNHLTRKLFAMTLTVVALSPFALDGMIHDNNDDSQWREKIIQANVDYVTKIC